MHPVIEYSLEFPYGRQARIWVTTETACYRIMSVSANYVSYWQPFYDMVCFSGHVINILLNYRGHVLLFKLITSIAKLSGKEPETTYNLLRQHRKFIFDLLKDQSLPAKIRKEYNVLQSNQSVWELDWSQHESFKASRSTSGSSTSIFSFFKPAIPTENINNSSTSLDLAPENRNSIIDETSSLLSISEDESATFIEYPNEIQQSFDIEMCESSFSSLSTAFMKPNFLSWKLPDFTEIHTRFTCPVCNLTLNMIEKDSFSSFRIHINAHIAELPKPDQFYNSESPLNFDFETRFNNFRSDLRKFIDEKIVYKPINLQFDKKITFKPSDNISFSKYPLLGSEESKIANPRFNPISTALKQPSAPPNTNIATPVPSAPKPRKVVKTASATGQSSASATAIISNSSSSAVNKNSSNINSVQVPPSPNILSNPNLDGTRAAPNPVVVKNIMPSSTISNSNNLVKTKIDPISQKSTFFSAVPAKSLDPNLHKPDHINRILSSTSISTAPNDSSLKSKLQETKLDASAQEVNISKSTSSTSIPIAKSSSSISVVNSSSNNNRIPPPLPFNVLQSFQTPDKKSFGCKHYSLNCLFFANCCDKWFSCRFCHDEVSDHQVNRHETRHCICILCGTVQVASSKCCNAVCGIVLAKYYCDKCKFWDNSPTKHLYHCDKCKVCRKGEAQNSEHCDRCNKCIPRDIYSSHGCPLDDSKKKCIYCDELINHTVPYLSLKCLHMSHVSCQNRIKTACPKCTPNLENLSIVQTTSASPPLKVEPLRESISRENDKSENLNLYSQIPLKLIFKNVSRTPSPQPHAVENDSNVKKVKLDQVERSQQDSFTSPSLKAMKSPAPSSVTNPPTNQVNYVNYLKNSLGNMQSLQKSPESLKVSTLNSLKPIRTCWNCSKVVPDNPDCPSTQKYCFNCSAILE